MSEFKFIPPKDKSWAKDVAKELGIKSSKEAKGAKKKETFASSKMSIVHEGKVNHFQSMEIAELNNGRLANLREFIIGILADPMLLKKLKGELFFLAENRAVKENNLYKIDFIDGDVKAVSKEEYHSLPAKERVRAYFSGKEVCAVRLGSDTDALFVIHTLDKKSHASLVLCVKN